MFQGHQRKSHFVLSDRTGCINAVLSAIMIAMSGVVWSPEVQAQTTTPAIASNALPTGGRVVAGRVDTHVTGSNLNLIQTSNAAIMNWASFNLGTSAKVNIQQPSSNAILLNRVVGPDPSQIQGQIQANGQVMLVNPNGIVIGRDGSVSASGFTASSYGISDENFLNGRHQFDRQGSTAGVRNDGSIKVQSGGYVHLIGAQVNNRGLIQAPQGTVVMAAGESVTVGDDFQVPLSQRVKVSVTASSIQAAVTNTVDGLIVTEGGQVLLQAAALADAVASVTHQGRIDTQGPQGGSVTILAGRGNIKVDGVINASSTQSLTGQPSKGGDVVIGRDPVTGTLALTTDVSGASIVSDKGFVETSGHLLNTANVRIKAGVWSLDPNDVEINSSGTTSSLGTSVVIVSDIQNALNQGTSVTISTGVGTSGAGSMSSMNGLASNQAIIGTGSASQGNILVKDSIYKTKGASATLTLLANNNIVVDANAIISSSYGRLNVSLNSNLSDVSGAIVMNPGSKIFSNGGFITLGGGLSGLGPAVGNGSILNGISLLSASLIANGGDITLNGKSNQLQADHQNGILLSGNSLIQTSWTGKISLTGVSQASGSSSNAHGIRVDNSTISAGSAGAIEMNGTSSSVATGTGLSGVVVSGTSLVQTTGAPISITGIAGGSGTADGYGIDVIGGKIHNLGGGSIQLTTDSLSLLGANNSTPGVISTIYSGTGKTTIQNLTAGTLINIGGDDQLSGTLTLGVSNAEINQITAGTLQIGSETSGNLAVSTAMVTNGASGNIYLRAGGSITVNQTMTSAKGLFLQTNGQPILISSEITGSNVSLDTSNGTINPMDGSIQIGDALVSASQAVQLTSSAKLTSTSAGGAISIVSNESILNNGVLIATNNTGYGSSIKLLASNGIITGAGQIGSVYNARANVAFEQAGNSQYDGAIYAENLNKNGVGTLTFRNQVVATNFNINTGTAQIGDGSAATTALPSSLTASKIYINSAGQSLIFNRVEDTSSQAVITGAGNLILIGPGILTLTGDSSAFAGTTQIQDGRSLWMGTGGSLGTDGSSVQLLGNGSRLVFTEASGVSNVGSRISGAGSISQVGTGTGMLSGANTYTGATTVLAGTLKLNNADALGNTTSTTIGVNNTSTASLDVNGLTIAKDMTVNGQGNAATIGAITNSSDSAAELSGVVTLATDANLGGNHPGSIVLSNKILGAYGLTKVGNNALILDVSVNGTTTTSIQAGTLQIGNGGTKGSLGSAGSVTTQGTLAFMRSDNIDLTTQITGSGGLAQLGTGVLTLLDSASLYGANNYQGSTIIRAGKLQVGNGGTAGNLGAGSIINHTLLEINRQDSVILAQSMSGSGQLIQQGQGTTILAASNTNTGKTTINGGVLQVGNNGTTGQLGTGDVVLNNQSLIKYFLTTNATMANLITGVGQVQASITGALTVAKGINLTSGKVALTATGKVVSNASIQSVGGTLISGDQGVDLNSQVSNTGAGTVVIAAGQALAAGDASGGQVVVNPNASVSNTGGGNVYIYSGSPTGSPNLSTLSPTLANAYNLPTYDPTQVAFGQAYGSTIAGGGSSQIIFRQTLASISPTPYPRPLPSPNPNPSPSSEVVSEMVASISPTPWPTSPSSPKPTSSPAPSSVAGDETGTNSSTSAPLRPTMLASVLGGKSAVRLTSGRSEQFDLSSFEECKRDSGFADLCSREDDVVQEFENTKDKDRRRQVNEIVRRPNVLQRIALLMSFH